MNKIEQYVSTNYLWTPATGTRFQLAYLIVSMAILVTVIGYRIFIAIKGGRPTAYRAFDKLWFWCGLVFGFTGLFVYFSRTQGLPIFSTRLISYGWILAAIGFATYLVFYFRMTVPEKVADYYTKERKAKYLKR